MIKIEEFAFCFFSSDIDIVVEQERELTKLSNKYLIERWYRHDRNVGKYVSFSQMVNDAIDDTNCEFMIFCNPKTKFTSTDIEFIIDKLSKGYCFASVVSFGFFGFSKELIRQIGMLDERFINGEWEDDDFAIRLKHFGKASWWGYDYDKYESNWSKSGNMKHITSSIFELKYRIIDSTILIDNNFFTHKKISKRHRKSNKEIYNSWLSSDYNNGDGKMFDYLTKYNTKIIYSEVSEELINFNFNLTRDKSEYRLEMLSNHNFNCYFVFLKQLSDDRKILWSDKIQNNTWKTLNISYDEEVEIRLFFDDNQIYNNIITNVDNVSLNFKLPKIIKKHEQYFKN
jgi:hypothetical protein